MTDIIDTDYLCTEPYCSNVLHCFFIYKPVKHCIAEIIEHVCVKVMPSLPLGNIRSRIVYTGTGVDGFNKDERWI